MNRDYYAFHYLLSVQLIGILFVISSPQPTIRMYLLSRTCLLTRRYRIGKGGHRFRRVFKSRNLGSKVEPRAESNPDDAISLNSAVKSRESGSHLRFLALVLQ